MNRQNEPMILDMTHANDVIRTYGGGGSMLTSKNGDRRESSTACPADCLALDAHNILFGATTMTLLSGRNDTHNVPVVVLNDQGGSIMNVSYGCTSTLRAQEHGHQPVVVYDANADHGYKAFSEVC